MEDTLSSSLFLLYHVQTGSASDGSHTKLYMLLNTEYKFQLRLYESNNALNSFRTELHSFCILIMNKTLGYLDRIVILN